MGFVTHQCDVGRFTGSLQNLLVIKHAVFDLVHCCFEGVSIQELVRYPDMQQKEHRLQAECASASVREGVFNQFLQCPETG